MKPTRLAWWVWAVIATTAILWPLSRARADDPAYTYDDGGTVIRLWNRPCTGLVMKLAKGSSLPEAWQARLQAITSTFAMGPHGEFGRKDFSGCWALLTKKESGYGRELLLMLFDDGDAYLTPPEDMKRYPRRGESES